MVLIAGGFFAIVSSPAFPCPDCSCTEHVCPLPLHGSSIRPFRVMPFSLMIITRNIHTSSTTHKYPFVWRGMYDCTYRGKALFK